jgi:hypothetical protein
MGQIKTLKIDNAAASGAVDILDPGAGKIVRVLGYTLVIKAASDVKFLSGSTDITGLMGGGTSTVINASMVDNRDYPHFQTLAAGDKLRINSSNAVQVGGHITVEVQG